MDTVSEHNTHGLQIVSVVQTYLTNYIVIKLVISRLEFGACDHGLPQGC